MLGRQAHSMSPAESIRDSLYHFFEGRTINSNAPTNSAVTEASDCQCADGPASSAAEVEPSVERSC